MGTKERRHREFAEREQRILDAARELIRNDGLLSLQMSRLAEACEYAVGTLYLHFSSKEDLLLALATEDLALKAQWFARVRDWSASTRDRMFAIGVADTLFIRQYPDHFRIAQLALCEVVWHAASAEAQQRFLAANLPISRVVQDIVDAAVSVGDLQLHTLRPQELSLGFWSLVVGTHNLVQAAGVLENLDIQQPYLLMCAHLQRLLDGFLWAPITPWHNHDVQALIQRIRSEVFSELPAECCA